MSYPATDPVQKPDLILYVERARAGTQLSLRFLLDSSTTAPVRLTQPLAGEPFEYFRALFGRIEEIQVADTGDEARRMTRRQLEGIGATLAEQLLSKDLRDRLLACATLDPGETARTLLVISDDPWIPWELLRLRGDDGGQGPFLGEAFAITRWPWQMEPTLELPCHRIGMVTVAPDSWELPEVTGERDDIRSLARETQRRFDEVPARFNDILDSLASRRYTAWHFCGHGVAGEGISDLWEILLDEGDSLRAADLKASGCDLSKERPLVFMNACRSARMQLALSRSGGLPQAFLEAGAGAVVGTHWAIDDEPARAYAQAFYESFLIDGAAIGEAARQARLRLRQKLADHPSWLAYTVFAHPLAATADGDRPRSSGFPLVVPDQDWQPEKSPPGALLRADYEVVPFHGRDDNLVDLLNWSRSDAKISIRLYHGSGGMGKTRLALEMCRRLESNHWWVGFLHPDTDSVARETGRRLISRNLPLFVVVDYAETRREMLTELLRQFGATRHGPPVRLLLLARSARTWWAELKRTGHGVGELLSGPASSVHRLEPLALTLEQRQSSYRLAAKAFSQRLKRPEPSLADDLNRTLYERVLLLHMRVLIDIEGHAARGENDILSEILNREERFWSQMAQARSLPAHLVPGIGRALAAVTLAGGVDGEENTVRLLERIAFFGGQPRSILVSVAHLLHDCYPGERWWIDSILPDLLGEHLIDREMRQGSRDLMSLALGD